MNIAAMVVLILSTCAALLVAPDIHVADIGEPAILATLGTPPLLAMLVVLRLVDAHPIVERRLLALFLLLMPTVYLSSLVLHGGGAAWSAVEMVGRARLRRARDRGAT